MRKLTPDQLPAGDRRTGRHPSRGSGLVLDFGGVLTTGIAACTHAFERRTGLPEGALLSLITKDPVGVALYADLERGAIGQQEWSCRVAELLGIDGANLLGRVLADLRPEPSVITAARAARCAGVRVGILSNSVGLAPYNIYAGYELSESYDAVVLSEHYKLRKPDPEIYHVMLRLMKLPGEECVFVDDTAHNLPPAEALGMATVLARDPAETVARLEELLGMRLVPGGG